MSGFRLVVTEKPSVARDIARVLGVRGNGQGVIGSGDLRITWCLGHLVELAEPAAYDKAWKSWRMDTLPMLPPRFKLRARKKTGDQWSVVKGLLKHADLGEVVNACDAGREGELIFSNVFRLSGSRAPVVRLWISSMTDAAIRDGFARLRPGAELANLDSAARCRSEADWLVGLNATRAMTIRARSGRDSTLLSLGRVQTPTLAMIGEREEAIERFVPETFWQVKVRLGVDAGDWEALYNQLLPDGKRADRLTDQAAAQAVLDRIHGRDAVIGDVTRKRTREKPPLLYDLTNLQKEANRRFRYSAKRTLEIAQALYEKHKVLTYPRTDSRHLGSDQVPLMPDLIGSLRFGPYEQAANDVLGRWPVNPGKRVFDDAEISDHHALIPTGVDPRNASLDRDDKRIYDLVARRFLGAFHPDAVFAVMTVDALIGDDLFAARGRSCLEPGWRAVDPPKSGKKKKDEVVLPPVDTGDAARQLASELHEGQTKPPKRFTEATLLGAMERAGEALDDAELKRAMKRNGLGTPATRAAIIETLLSRSYIERNARQLLPTAQGRALLSVMPVPALRSPRMTGEWEARLVAIAEGEETREAFMTDIRQFTAELVEAVRAAEVGAVGGVLRSPVAEGKVLGACPRCGAEVRADRAGWNCTACDFRLWGVVAKRELSERMARQLLVEGRTAPVKGFKSRKGKDFRAALRLDDEGKVVFEFPEPDPLGECPACHQVVARRGKVYTCSSGRDCPFVIWGEMGGLDIPADAVKAVLADGRSALLTGFKSKAGRSYDGVLEWTGTRVKVVRVDTGPPPAFGHRVDCPVCVHGGDGDPGYVIAGKAAWGCSKWRDGCLLRVPFEVEGEPIGEEDARRLFSAKRATRYVERRMGPSREVFEVRVVLKPEEDPCWGLQRRNRR
jgi:DNA topoisomerase III